MNHTRTSNCERYMACSHGKRLSSKSLSPDPPLPRTPDDTEIDPFTFRPPLTAWDYVKIAINTLWLLPIRLFLIVLPTVLLASMIGVIATLCEGFDEENPIPLTGWRWFIVNTIGRQLDRVFLFGFGFHWVHTKGVPQSAREAPIIVVAPHSSILDIFVVTRYHVPSCVCKAGIRSVPFFGSILIARTVRSIFVAREDSKSRMRANQEIRKRAHSEGMWPKLMIFPEGTTTNRKVLLRFKHGAFTPKLPVQPILIKFNNRVNTMVLGDGVYSTITSLYFTLCQFHNSLEVEFQPVYHPSQEEMDEPKLFAENVRKAMSKGLGIRASEHAVEDLFLMKMARKRGAPFSSGMVVYARAKTDLQMNVDGMKVWFKKFAAMDGDRDGYIRVEDMARFLGISIDACTQAVFNSFQPNADGKLSFRSYLYGVITQSKPLIESEEFLQMVFEFFDQDCDGVVSQADVFSKPLIGSLPNCDPGSENVAATGKMNFDDFKLLLSSNLEYLLLFHERQNARISSGPQERGIPSQTRSEIEVEN